MGGGGRPPPQRPRAAARGRAISVCPGFLGGVETPIAVADARVFVPVVDLCYPESNRGSGSLGFYRVEPATGKGRFAALDLATGRLLWERRFPSPSSAAQPSRTTSSSPRRTTVGSTASTSRPGVPVWEAQAPAGINACPAVAGDLLLVQAGTDHPSFGEQPTLGLVAYRLAR